MKPRADSPEPRAGRRGEATLVVLLAVVVLGAGVWAGKRFFHGDTRRAKASQEATVRIEQAAAAEDAAAQKQGATAAASVVKIGEAAATAPASPERDFIVREVPIALANLPKPDPEALLAAERRKVAVMEGRLEEVARLYGEANRVNAQLEAETARARAERDAAMEERNRIDRQLAEVAASRRGAELQAMALGGVALLAFGLWGYAKLYGIGPQVLGQMAARVRTGESAIAVMDELLPVRLQRRVRQAAQLATDLDRNGNGIPDSQEKKA